MAPDPGQITVSVVIPARNAGATIARQLDAVIAQLPTHGELIVVDNGSTDDTAEVIDRYLAPGAAIRRVTAPEPGTNRARNAGIGVARGRYVLLCDADDEVQPGWVAGMAAALDQADLVGGAVRCIIPADQPMTAAGRGSPRLPVLWDLSSPWGCSCGLRREVWQRMGGFDERMSGGSDEIDFFLRAQLRGSTVAWADDATVHYLIEWNAAYELRRRRENEIRLCRAYWAGRGSGRPGRGGLSADLRYLVRRAPRAVVSGEYRARWLDRARLRWWRLRGFARFGLGELLRSRARRSGSGGGVELVDLVPAGPE
jgi:glycosyltransferase involved in cell wall biosynthesis